MLLCILRAIQSFKDYHRNLRELSQLTDRELADIGIDRADIPARRGRLAEALQLTPATLPPIFGNGWRPPPRAGALVLHWLSPVLPVVARSRLRALRGLYLSAHDAARRTPSTHTRSHHRRRPGRLRSRLAGRQAAACRVVLHEMRPVRTHRGARHRQPAPSSSAPTPSAPTTPPPTPSACCTRRCAGSTR